MDITGESGPHTWGTSQGTGDLTEGGPHRGGASQRIEDITGEGGTSHGRGDITEERRPHRGGASQRTEDITGEGGPHRGGGTSQQRGELTEGALSGKQGLGGQQRWQDTGSGADMAIGTWRPPSAELTVLGEELSAPDLQPGVTWEWDGGVEDDPR